MQITLDPKLDLRLNRIQSGDQPSLYSLMKDVYPYGYKHYWEDGGQWYVELIYNPETVRKEIARSRSHYFFVVWNGEKVGILKYDFPFSPREVEIPNAMKLHRLYLHPKAQGQGVAQVLMEHCFQVALENGLETIWLEAMESQAQAKRFYEKMGFELAYTYTLDFERIFPEYRSIQILKKSLK